MRKTRVIALSTTVDIPRDGLHEFKQSGDCWRFRMRDKISRRYVRKMHQRRRAGWVGGNSASYALTLRADFLASLKGGPK